MSNRPEVAGELLPAAKFPVTLTAIGTKTGREVWTETVEKPDGLVSVWIPPLAKQYGELVRIRIEYGDGVVEFQEPPA